MKLKVATTAGSFLLILTLAGTIQGATPKQPNFYARHDYPGLFSDVVGVADTNGDGIPDLIAIQNGYVEVLFGNGDGTFRPGANSNIIVGASSLALADLNADGKVDLVEGGSGPGPGNSGGIGVSFGNGDGTFQFGVFYEVPDTGFGLGYMVLADFNGDGIPDVAATGHSGVWLLTGAGGGVFNSAVLVASLPAAVSLIATTDFNGDHNLDLVVQLISGGVTGAGFAVLLGNGNGTFQTPQIFPQPKKPSGLAVGPLTKGGYPGIALTYNGYAYLYFGNGAGGFTGPEYVSLPSGRDIALGDVNGDGIPDLVSDIGYIDYGIGGGKFTSPVEYPIQTYDSFNVVLADLRNNGRTDIVANSYNAISVLLNAGHGAFEDGIWTNVPGGAGCGTAADFNRDGKPDLAVNNAQGVSILLGTGKAGSPFTLGPTLPLPNAECLITGDLNGDGIPDLLVPSPGTVTAYLGRGDGTFSLTSTVPTPSGGYLGVGDFNHDGKLDFVTSGNLLVLGNGDGTFQAPTAFVPSPPLGGFSNLAVGDINNDGWPDVVLTNLNVPYSNLYVLLNDQQGGFTQVPATFGALTAEVVLADVNRDGNLDIILSYASGDGASVYLGNGTGEFKFQVGLPNPTTGLSTFNIVADVNGDGIPDVEVLSSNTLAIFLGEGGATYAAPFYIGTGPSPGEILVENLHGQKASAGIPDIVAPDNSGGVMVLPNLTK